MSIEKYIEKKTIADFIVEMGVVPSELFRYIAENYEEHGCVDIYEDERWNDVLIKMSKAFNKLADELEDIEEEYYDVCPWNNREEDE